MEKEGLILLVGIFLISVVCAFSGDGDGSSANPFVITNCTQLQEMKDNLTANYSLGNDINCSDTINWNSGAGFEYIGTGDVGFSGKFEGNNYSISGVFANRTYSSIFRKIQSSGNVSNVGFEDLNLNGVRSAPIISNGGTISNSYSTGNVIGNYSGGFVQNNGGTISNSYSAVSVAGTYIGGFAYENYKTISNSYSTGNITGSSSGGFACFNYKTISNSYSTGNITGSSSGGFIYVNLGLDTVSTISNSYSTGNVIGNYSGGFIHNNNGQLGVSTISNSYSTGNVTGVNVSGFVYNNNGISGVSTISNSYSTGNVSGINATGFNSINSAGVINSSFYDTNTSGQSTGNGVPKTTEEMKTQSTFVGWDFEDTWYIDSEHNDGYPFLRVFRDYFSPTINLTSPLNASSFTGATYNITFQFNVSDESEILNCSLVLNNGTAISNSSSVSKTEVNNLSVVLANNSYDVFVRCYDVYNNSGVSSNVSFTITAPVVEEEEETHSSSSGGGSSNTVTSVSDSMLENGFARVLNAGMGLKFNLNSESHNLKLNSILNGKINFTISSEPQSFVLSAGESVKVDVDFDDKYDIVVSYLKNYGNRVELKIEKYSNGETSVVDGENASSSNLIDGGVTILQGRKDILFNSQFWAGVGAVLICLAGILGILDLLLRKEKQRKK